MTQPDAPLTVPVSPEGWPKDCRLLEFPSFPDERGTLSFLEGSRHIPFDIRRIFYLYDVPAGKTRAAHALIKCQQCLIPISGSFEVTLDDGSKKLTCRLDRPNLGLYVPPIVWREVHGFSRGAVCLVLASEPFDAADYYDTYADFLRAVGGNRA
ncbi:MAG TPA: FdtA/QdtA family cupin domain-containing protein [Anaerolineales bacterium]|nr:FdtA/QdtA family cupin domain-containing protein [Anaerolineales bacterium]